MLISCRSKSACLVPMSWIASMTWTWKSPQMSKTRPDACLRRDASFLFASTERGSSEFIWEMLLLGCDGAPFKSHGWRNREITAPKYKLRQDSELDAASSNHLKSEFSTTSMNDGMGCEVNIHMSMNEVSRYIVVNEARSGSSWPQEISQMHPGIKVQFKLDLQYGPVHLLSCASSATDGTFQTTIKSPIWLSQFYILRCMYVEQFLWRLQNNCQEKMYPKLIRNSDFSMRTFRIISRATKQLHWSSGFSELEASIIEQKSSAKKQNSS